MAGQQRRLVAHTYVHDENGDVVWFGPDDDVPAWAAKKIDNPAAWGEAEAESSTSADDEGDDDDAVSYSDRSWTKAKLEAEIERRNEGRAEQDLIEVEEPGNKPELIAALEADDAAQEG